MTYIYDQKHNYNKKKEEKNKKQENKDKIRETEIYFTNVSTSI